MAQPARWKRPWAWPLAPVYAAGLAVKDGLRQLGVLRTRTLKWPVVSVGSLSAGGAGKTPVVIALAELLGKREWYVDVLSRGYGRDGRGVERVDPDATDAARRFGDEPVLIAQRAGVPVWVGADRFEAGEAAESTGAIAGSSAALGNDKVKRVHLLDDGFQHRQLARTMDVVLITAEDFEDALLPAGNLREAFTGLCRADVVVVREEEREPVVPKLQGYLRSDSPVWVIRRQLSFPPHTVLQSDDPEDGHIVFSAIARPADFVRMLRETGVHTLEMVAFPDHHVYTVDDIKKLVETYRDSTGKSFITTEKDAVKLSPAMRARLEAAGPLVVARLDSLFVDEDRVVRDLEARIS